MKLLKELEGDLVIGDKIIPWIYGMTITIWIVSYSIWVKFGVSTFYIGTAITILGLCFTIYISKSPIPKWLSSFGCFVATNNFLDEILFVPWEINWTEYVIGFVAFIYYYKKYRRKVR